MASLVEILQRVLTLTSNVDSLKSDVRRMNETLLALTDRITRLEMSGEIVAEKAKNAALTGAYAATGDLNRRLARIEASLEFGGRSDRAARGIEPPGRPDGQA